MATHSSILAWRIPWTEGASMLTSMGSPRAGGGSAHTHTLLGDVLGFPGPSFPLCITRSLIPKQPVPLSTAQGPRAPRALAKSFLRWVMVRQPGPICQGGASGWSQLGGPSCSRQKRSVTANESFLYNHAGRDV